MYSSGSFVRWVYDRTATMIAAGTHITANRIIGSTFDFADRPRPYAPRRLCENSDQPA